jgi:hypothetical protein
MVTYPIEEPALPPHRRRVWLHVGKNTPGRPLSNSDLPQTPSLIFLISSVTIPVVLIPFAQITSGPSHTQFLPLPLPPRPQSPLPPRLSPALLEVLIFPSPQYPAGFHQRHHRHLHLSVPPIGLCMGGGRPLSSRRPSLLHSLFRLLRLSSLPSLMLHGLDTVFPQIPRQQ